ncbi:hypothetical protein Cch01nite_11640 [Cellulomonas chitinilytica]|uniref:Uncharacterized protein n=1 Tax=Cellulomonas chitinilytica TaxID=398759 RepID=A0A919P0J6_9CELL|nr:hypothetical protein [Cellulomonas chitinilytica]GIG20440.1 hypothetical protein Cch01nite_11640 [Cellulomonas chitinilytica]
MKAHVTYTQDGKITSVGLGGHLAAEDDERVAEVDLPASFPKLSGPDAERAVARAVAALVVRPGGTLGTAT